MEKHIETFKTVIRIIIKRPSIIRALPQKLLMHISFNFSDKVTDCMNFGEGYPIKTPIKKVSPTKVNPQSRMLISFGPIEDI